MKLCNPELTGEYSGDEGGFISFVLDHRAVLIFESEGRIARIVLTAGSWRAEEEDGKVRVLCLALAEEENSVGHIVGKFMEAPFKPDKRKHVVVPADMERMSVDRGDLVMFRSRAPLTLDRQQRAGRMIEQVSKATGIKMILMPDDWDVFVLREEDQSITRL